VEIVGGPVLKDGKVVGVLVLGFVKYFKISKSNLSLSLSSSNKPKLLVSPVKLLGTGGTLF
jgi:hypothetical protein